MLDHYLEMIAIMISSGILSSMWVWSDKLSDIRLSINDFYMIGLMTSWMCLIMAILYWNPIIFIISSIAIIAFYIAIRQQLFIGLGQFYAGMIPHHSMALLMSKRLLEKQPDLNRDDREFILRIIKTQETEIEWMKSRL